MDISVAKQDAQVMTGFLFFIVTIMFLYSEGSHYNYTLYTLLFFRLSIRLGKINWAQTSPGLTPYCVLEANLTLEQVTESFFITF